MNKYLFMNEKYYLEEKNQDYTKFIFKVLPQYMDFNERKRFRDFIISIKLLAQMNDDLIPNYEDNENIYRTIMYLEFIVKDIKVIYKYIEILHRLFKAPTIIKIADNKQNYFYSFSLKRLNKLDSNEIVIDNIENTIEYSGVVNSLIREEYEQNITDLKNMNNKYEYYYELLLRTKIYSLKGILNDDYYELLNSNMFYDINKMKYNFEQLCIFGDLNNKLENIEDISTKYEIRSEINNIKFKL